MKKYNSLKELADAYSNGELHRSYLLTIDNDTTDVYAPACLEARRKPIDWDSPDSVSVFSMHPYALQEQALDLLGIPNEPC